MNYDAEFCQQFRVSEEEKRQCFARVSEILALAIKARNFGLLSLGKEAEESSSFLLRKGLQLALDGVKSHTARTILELYILTGDYTGKELLERCIILEGVIGILDGVHPKLLKELLLSFLGETGHIIFKGEFEVREKEKLLSYLEKIEKKPAATNSSAKLGKIIAKLDEKAIKRFLQIIHIDDLAKTAKDMDGKAQIKIFDHLPDRGASMLFEAIEQMDSIEHHEIVEAQNKFVAIMSELRDQGRI
ncbi:MAG: FliG C-terminal domain-containing protein [Desulfobacterales bacterium]